MIWIIAVIIWCACGLAGSIIGERRGRSNAGAALGFFFGPFGVFATFFLPVDPSRALQPEAPSGVLKYNCPRCRKPLLNSRKGRGTCSHCGNYCVGHE